jgi:hypothetical protein
MEQSVEGRMFGLRKGDNTDYNNKIKADSN